MGASSSQPEWSFKDIPDLTGFRVLVTGGNAGIGKAAVENFIEHTNCAKVILACRSEERAKAAIAEIVANTPIFPGAAPTADRLEFLSLDLADLDQVRVAAEELKKRFDRIDICINNAGLAKPPGDKHKTKAGHDMCMGVNHFGHFLFNARIFPLLLASKAVTKKPARIVAVTSYAHNGSKGVDMDDINYVTRKASTLAAYSDSKLANIQYMYSLGEKLKERGLDGDVTITAPHPGLAASEIWRDIHWSLQWIIEKLAAVPRDLSCNEVRAAVDEGFAAGTYTQPERMQFYGPPVVAETSAVSKDLEQCEKLWKKTEELVGEAFFADGK